VRQITAIATENGEKRQKKEPKKSSFERAEREVVEEF